ncbi:MAG TPA: S41 family peptidase [Chryseosolibacter sp.]|nr:S41 family peptidase [Chryseosolibacter sp.]
MTTTANFYKTARAIQAACKLVFDPRTFWIVLLFISISCHDDEIRDQWHRPAQNSVELEGIWQSVGYGRILDIRKGKADLYDISGGGCIARNTFFDGPGFDVGEWTVEVNRSRTQFKYFAQGSVNILTFSKIATLPAQCSDGGLQTTEALTNFDYLWSVFDEHYVSFDERKINWQSIRDQYRAQVTTDNLWDTFTAMLVELGDDHVTLTHPDGTVFKAGQQKLFGRFYHEYAEAGEPGDFETYIQSEFMKILGNIQTGYLNGEVKSAANDRIFWGKLDNNIGYLHILEMSGYRSTPDPGEQLAALKVAMDQVVEDLKGCDGIVVDVRFNSGGLDLASLEIAGRFTSETKTVWNIQALHEGSLAEKQTVELTPTGETQLNKKVLVLTSQFTASAAETFTMAMTQLEGVKTMGEKTNGIFSTMLGKKLPNSWHFTLSNERWTDPQGNSFEAIGIAPDISVDFPSAAQRNNGTDPVLDQAIGYFQ